MALDSPERSQGQSLVWLRTGFLWSTRFRAHRRVLSVIHLLGFFRGCLCARCGNARGLLYFSNSGFRAERAQPSEASCFDLSNVFSRPLTQAIEELVQSDVECEGDLEQRLQIETAARFVLAPLGIVVARGNHDMPHVEILRLANTSDASPQGFQERSKLFIL